jgi:broad specificity phosphatase PhoE
MNDVIIARHGKSVAIAEGIANGDPARDGGLTEEGRQQAQELGRLLEGERIDVCVTSAFPRTRETAEIALAGRDVAFMVLDDIDDVRLGDCEGKPRSEYRDWVKSHSITTPLPGGGESRVEVAARACRGIETILALPHPVALLVTHELIISDLFAAVEGQEPPQVHMDIAYATPYRFQAEQLQDAIRFLRQWAESELQQNG